MRPTTVLLVLLFGAGLPVSHSAAGQASPAWQQHVRYEMDITLHPHRHQMDGRQRLTYFNNAPDTLHHVFYHLYFNAFHPHSMMAQRNRHLPDPDGRIVPRIWNLGPDEIGYQRIRSLTQNGKAVAFEVDDTVMRVALAEPILPGDSAVFDMAFHAQVPLQTRRSGRDNSEGVDYTMSQWYPKMAGYDSRGWHAVPYVGREFYAPYGTFDVRITLPAAFTLGATGVLRNPDAVGHGYQTDPNAAFNHGPADSLTWHFHAEDVHDFAWAADTDYIHDRFEGPDGVTYHLLYLPDVADTWAQLRAFTPRIIQALGRLVGPYPYPQFTVAQAGDGGMEYPMIIFIVGRGSPAALLSVTGHEAAHQWFYGVLGSNETRYSWMDEGFTTYARERAMQEILGRPGAGFQASILGMLTLQHLGLAERLSTPADWFETNTAYGVASYSGGAMIADMLGYVISDPLRDAWLRALFRRFKFRHPNPYDVEKVAEDVSGLQLDWFFEQFTNTTHTLDYAVAGLEARGTGRGWTATITLRRHDPVVMPVDLRLTLEDGSVQWVHIPLGIMEGHKPVPAGWLVAAPWHWTSPAYTLTVELPRRVVEAEIDPEGRTPDRNRLNNTSGFPVQARFLQPPRPSWFTYGVGYRPLLQYADAFGFGAGFQVRGRYLFDTHRVHAMLKLWPEVLFSGGSDPGVRGVDVDGSALDGIDYAAAYATEVPALGPRASLSIAARKHLGVLENTLTLARTLSGHGSRAVQQVAAALVHQYAHADRALLTAPSFPFPQEHMASARVAYDVQHGADRLTVSLEVGGSMREGSGRNANRLFVDAATSAQLTARLRGTARLMLGFGAEQLALHKRFRLGAPAFEDAWRSDAFRTAAAAFEDPVDDVHLVAFSGAGPVAYLLGDNPAGSNAAAGSLAIRYAPGDAWLRPLALEAFSGLGTAWNTGRFGDGFDPGDLVADAGLGVSYDVSQPGPLQRWTAQSDVLAGLRLAARFPLWVSDPGLIAPGEDAVAFRWLIGIQTDM